MVDTFDNLTEDYNKVSAVPESSEHAIAFEAYGVRVHLAADDADLLNLAIETAKKALVNRLTPVDCAPESADHRFAVHRTQDGRLFFDDNGEPSTPVAAEVDFCRLLNSMIRVQIAAKAKRHVFIHAGVVAVDGKAIVMPGDSYAGKTRLVAELIRRGAVYYSDEYAVLDESGLVHPFERNLSMRPDGGYVPFEVDPTELGGVRGKVPVPAGMLVLTKYEPSGQWKPERISTGQAILEIVPRAIGVKNYPEFYLTVLNTTFKSAIILKSLRGEAAEAAEKILEAFHNLPVLKGSGCFY